MRTLLAALALFVLALALRLPHGELAEWKGDEAIQFAHARAIAREHVLPARGLPTTDGPRLPVHFLYVLAVPLFFEDSPEAIRVFVALLSSATVVLAFLVGKRDVGARTALAWALLLACLPDEVRRGRWSWNPNLIPPLATIALLVAFRLARRREGAAGGGLVFLSALMPLVHYSLVGLGAFAFFFGTLLSKNRRALFSGLVLALLVGAPHVVIESRSGFQATRGALAVAGAHGADPERAPFRFVSLLVGELELESYAKAAGLEPPSFAPWLSWVVKGLLLLGVALALLAFAKKRALEPPLVALLAATGAWTPFLLLGLPARQHYVQTAFPAAVFLVAHALSRLRAGPLRATPLLPVIGLASVLSVWLVLVGAERGLVDAGSDYDLPYGVKKASCEQVLAGELELVRYPRLEYLVLLEQCWRELPEAERERFELVHERIDYWDLELAIPHPRKPRGRAAIFAVGSKAEVVELP